MTGDIAAEPNKVENCYAAVELACQARGLAVERLPEKLKNWLGVSLTGSHGTWELDVDCNDASLVGLPDILLRASDRLRAHVSYRGGVCVSDNQGLSMDPERREEIVAFAVLAAVDLLDKWAADAGENTTEFYNELEGYWQGLPGMARARSTVEVDDQDRLIRFYVKAGRAQTNCFFSEWEVTKNLLTFNTKDLESTRALYFSLPEIPPPPILPNKLGPEFIEAIRQMLSPEQLELWARLFGASKNGPRNAALLISVPRAAGGRSLIGVGFTAKNGGVDEKAVVRPFSVRRFTPTYMRERGGASLELLDKHVVVLGCGAVGSVVADSLAAAGVGQLTLVDHDDYSEDNVFRHIIDPALIGLPKVDGLKFELERRYPGLKVVAFTDCAQKWYAEANLANYDGIVLALGLPTLERSFANAFRKAAPKKFPMVFTWLEPLDLGGHSVALYSKGPGCLDCLYRDDEGASALAPRTSFLVPNQAIGKNLTGCSNIFVPYGALQSKRTGIMAAEHMLYSMRAEEPSYRYWVGDGAVAHEQGLETTSWWEEASRVPFDEATARAFGPPCKRCRGTT